MPVYSKIPIYTFTLSENLPLTPQDDNQGQYVYPKFGVNWTMNMGDMAKVHLSNFCRSFESQYLKTRKMYRSELLHTSRV